MERLQTEHGVFTNNEVTGQTAQEVYNEWLSNMNNQPRQPTQEEIILQKVIDLLPASVIAESMDEQYQSALAELNLT